MSDAPRRDAPDDRLPVTTPPASSEPDVVAALTELDAARTAFGEALDELTSATQSALDVPAKIRRHPARTVALAGGAGFLLLGGPRRVARYVARRTRPTTRDPHAGLLPDEIEQVLRDSGVADDPEVRRALDEDFAEYLHKKGRAAPAPSAAASFWRTFDRVAGPLGTAGARIMVQRLMEADKRRSTRTSGDAPSTAKRG